MIIQIQRILSVSAGIVEEVQFAKTRNKSKRIVNSCTPTLQLPSFPCTLPIPICYFWLLFFQILISFLRACRYVTLDHFFYLFIIFYLVDHFSGLKYLFVFKKWTWYLACPHDFLSGMSYQISQLHYPLFFPSHDSRSVLLLTFCSFT